MGMSTHVVLLRDVNDPEHQFKVAAYQACKKANVTIPEELENYFDGGDMDYPLEIEFEPREWQNDFAQGFEIDIAEIPEGVKTIRFYNSW